MLTKDWIYKRGDIYLADLGTPIGSIQAGLRPVINIQNDTGSYHSPTLIIIPITTELKKLKQPTHFVLNKQRGLDEVSMAEAEQPVTINKSQIIKYLGKTKPGYMQRVDECLRVSMKLDRDNQKKAAKQPMTKKTEMLAAKDKTD